MKTISIIHLLVPLCGMAVAENAPLSPLLVEGRKETESLTAPTVQASRDEVEKTPGGVEVVDAERFLQGRANTMADTFFLSPGVVAQPRFGSDEARLSIRGSGMQRTFHGRGIRLLQDGVPLNLADGGFDMQSVDPLAVDYITILRGGNALAMGASTLGGAIDYHSSTGRTSPGGSMRLEAGSFDYLRARVETGVRKGDLDGYFSLSEHYQQGFRDHSEQNNQRLFGNLGWRIADNAETRVYLTAVRSRSEMPGSLTKAEMDADPAQADTSAFGAVLFDNRRDYELYRIASKTTIRNGTDTFDIIAAFANKDLDHPITPFVGVIDQLSNDVVFGGVYTRESELWGHANRFKAGATFSYGATDNATFANVSGSRGALTSDADQTATNIEGFVENQWEIGRGLTAVLGATAASNQRENDQNLGAAPSYDRSYENISPKVGLVWERDGLQIFGNISGSYEPPSFSETNGALTPNEAQTATTFEIGTRGAHANFRWDATLYASEVKDEFLALVDAFGVPLGTTNADKTIHQGVELFGEVDLLGRDLESTPDHRLFARGAWTYGRFEFDDDAVFGDNTIAGLPPHLIRGELMWENKEGYYAGPTIEWVPVKSYVDHANTLSADPFALLGFKVGRRMDSGFSWFIEAKNLTDETYAATTGVIADAGGVDSRAFLPGDGRSVFAGVEWSW
jgi:iron complex outermembrane recepter protein